MSTNTPIQNSPYESQGYKLALTAERIEVLLQALDVADVAEYITGTTLADLHGIINAIKEWDTSDDNLSVKEQLLNIYTKMLNKAEDALSKSNEAHNIADEAFTMADDADSKLSATKRSILGDMVNEALAITNSIKYYDNADIIPSSQDLFKFEIDEDTNTAFISISDYFSCHFARFSDVFRIFYIKN